MRTRSTTQSAILAIGLLVAIGCQDKPSDRDNTGTLEQDDSAKAADDFHPLVGQFFSVAKDASGKAKIFETDGHFKLVLNDVRVDSERAVRVYLVGMPAADTTRSVMDIEMKYDMAELDQGVAKQVVALPSRPDPAIRSVVLWDPAYGVNLAFADLLEE